MSKIYFHHDKIVVDYLKNNPNLPRLVSYPRTGSHWIRYVMEKYFKKPSLVMIYEYDNATEFTCYHTHDLTTNGTNLSNLKTENLIYLYREPVDTIYSTLKYLKQDQNDENLIKTHSNCYKKHLVKYLIDDNFTKNKVIIKYENFKNNFSSEFEKLCKFFKVDFNKDKIDEIIVGLDKEKIKQESLNTYSNINVSPSYDTSREGFKKKYSELINEIIFNDNEELKKYF